MYKLQKYSATDLMSDLICENYSMLLVLSRFGISLGFGDKSISQVCTDANVDVNTFLAVVNLLVDEDKETTEAQIASISVPALLSYLKNSHAYFLNFRLPSIRQKLMEAIETGNNDVSLLIINYFDEYVAEVRNHMSYEEKTVFPYIRSILSPESQSRYNIDTFSRRHGNIDSKLSELKNIIIKYYPTKNTNLLNSALFDIFSCARDLASHNDVENYLLVPAIRAVEEKQR